MSEKEGYYLYGIIKSSKKKSFGNIGVGGREDEVITICKSGFCGVVSQSPIVQYPATRENTLAHERVLEEVMKGFTVLPMRFATIVESEIQLKGLLEDQADVLDEELEKLSGKKELGLKAIAKKEIIFNDIVENDKNIKALKAKIAKLPEKKSYYDRIEIGRMVEDALEKQKQRYKETILAALQPLAVQVKENAPFGDRMILNTAFFIDDAREDEFDAKINELDEKLGDKIIFKYVGNLPPYNFVELKIKLKI